MFRYDVTTTPATRAIYSGGLLLLFLLLLCLPLSGQTSLSTLRGTVTDSSGAVVPGVEVSVEEVQTSIKARIVTTDNQGNYEIPDLKEGTYRLKAVLAGFKTFVASDVVLASNQTKRVDVVLEVGPAETEVTVSGAAPVIETEEGKIASEFSARQYKFVPIPANAYSSPIPVLVTMPQVQSTSYYGLTVAGQGGSQFHMGMDGVKEENQNTQTVNMEDAEEVKVVAINNSAEFARVGYYNVVTKRGGNEYHGEASYYHRNSALGAREFFAPEKTHQLYHTFNLSASGPIFKDKTFFYALWNAERVPGGTFYLKTVPTQRMRAGDFSQLLALDQIITDPHTGNPFPGNIIPSSRLDQTALTVQESYMPSPNLGAADDLANNFGFVHPYPGDQFRADVLVQRIDHKISEKNSLYGRLSTYLPRYVLPGDYPNLAWTRLRQSHSWVVVDTHVFSPRVVNTFTFGGNRDRVSDGETVDGYQPPTGDKVVAEIGLQGINPRGLSAMGFPRMDISGFDPITVQPGGVVQISRNFSYADSLSWSIGRHVWKFGGEVRTFRRFDGSIPEGTYGSFAFDGRLTGNAYADFLLGLPSTSTRLDPLTDRVLRSKELGLFVTDTFKVSSRLNLDYGLRWDYFISPSFADGLQYNWDPATGNVIVPESALSKVSPLYPTNTIKIVAGQVIANPDKKNFAPRLGVAYRLSNNTVIRGGYGIFTETLGPYAGLQDSQLDTREGPFQLSETFINTVQNGQPLFAFPNPFPSGAGEIASQSISGYPLNTRNGYIQQFNVTFERQVRDIGLRISYIGSRNRGMNFYQEVNKPQPSLIPFSDNRRPYPQFVSASLNRSNGEIKYNSMTVEAQRKVAQLMFDAHWTWAHNMSNFLNLENPYGPLLWNREFTPKHRVVLNVMWDLPFGRGARFLTNTPGVVNQIIGGWKLYWVAFLQTGQFFTPVFSGSDPSNTNTFSGFQDLGNLPDRIANGNLPSDQRKLDRWFDVGAFKVPGCPDTNPACNNPANIGRFGNSGVNILEGPGLHSHSLSVSKRFQLGERFHLDFMTMVSNLFNHPNFYNPSIDVSVPGGAGVIDTQHDLLYSAEKSGTRLIEIRLRLEF